MNNTVLNVSSENQTELVLQTITVNNEPFVSASNRN